MIAERIGAYVEEKGIKQTAIARHLNISKQSVNALFHGKTKMSVDRYADICDFLEVPYDRFVKEAREREQEQTTKDRG